MDSSPERAALALDRLTLPFSSLACVPAAERYRVASLFCSAYRSLARRGVLEAGEAAVLFDLGDVLSSKDPGAFRLALKARATGLALAMGRTPRRSSLVSGAMAFIAEKNLYEQKDRMVR